MAIKREWIDPKLVGMIATRHCGECNKDVCMIYQGSYLRESDNIRDMRDIYKCIADCHAKWKYEMENPGMKFVRPLFSYKRE
jgi:hypothetical protein